MNDKFCFSSHVIELSENDAYLEMINRVCYYDMPNQNGVVLPSDGAELFAQTIVNMPVYAKYRVNNKGEPTFGSHEVRLGEDGEIVFDTTPIGVHTSAEIKDDVVTVNGVKQTLPCLIATQRIWSRNKNAVAAIKRLFAEDKLHNSWELSNNAYTFENGLKTITDYEFIGNTLLGYEYAAPAYGDSAKVLSLSAADKLLVAEALSRDMIIQTVKQEEELHLNPENTIPETEIPLQTEPQTIPSTENPAAPESPVTLSPQTEGASLTTYDIYRKIANACRALIGKWCWVSYVFPEDHKALIETEDRPDELSYVQISYAVTENDTVTVSDPTDVKLAVSVSNMNAAFADLNTSIASLRQELEAARAEIDTLAPYRAAHEQAEHELKAQQLHDYAAASKQFSPQELEGEELSALIDSLDESAIKAMIADRVVSAKPQKGAPRALITKSSLVDDTHTECSAVLRDFFARK